MSKNDVRSHIKRIQKDNESFVNNPNGKRLINYFTLLNSDPAHFVWEMLQNAEDVRATAISFTLHEKNLYVWHNGSPFTPSNVESICSILLSDKSIVDGQIGKFGAGFKTVFAYTDAPEIYSGDYTFRINNLVSPEYIFKDESVKVSPTETLFILPFRNPETAKKDISRKLSQLSTQALMFLKHIEKITITINGISRDILRTVKEDVEISKYSSFEHIVVTDSKLDKEYYRFTLTGITLKDEDSTGKSFDVLNQSVMIAYRLNQSEKIVPISKSKDINKYFVYFPTEVETHLEFLAHAPFKTTVNRETIYSESSANETLYKKLIELVIISLKYLVKRNIADADFYNQILLPGGAVFPTDFPYDILKKKLIKEIGSGAGIIPIFDGGYCKFEELLIESYQNTEKDSVKNVFSVGEIGNTIKSYSHCKYWDSGYFKTNLHKLLRDVKEEYDPGENEINLKKVLDSLTPTWLSGKSLDEVVKFYKLFVNSPQTPSVNFNVIGRERLRTLPLVRTPEGKHITPQNAYWRSSDIHPDLMKDKLCSYFLHDMLQIGEYDAACEIRDVLKSRYGSDKIDVSPDVHLKDIESALSALTVGKLSLFDLANLNIIYAVNAKTNAKAWKKPSEVYLSSENGGDRDAEILLSGVSNIYFTHSMYKPLGNKLGFLGLQQPLHVEVMTDQFYCGQFVEQQIRDIAEFKKGQIYLFPQENFKPNVQLPYLKEIFASSFDVKKSLALYRLLSRNPQYIRGTVEWSTSKTNSSAKTIRHGTLEVYSELGYWLKIKPWIYSKDKIGMLPVKITSQNVHPEYLKDPALLELFEVSGVHSTKLSAMLPADANVSSEMRELIDATARYSPEELQMILDNLERPQSIKSIFTSLLEQNNEGTVPDEIEDDDNEFDPTPISNLEKRKKSLDNDFSKSLGAKKNNRVKEEDPDDWMKNPKVIKLLESASSNDEKLFFKTLGAALGTNLVDYGYADTTKEERAFLEQEYQGRCQICGSRIPKAIKQGSSKFPYHYVSRNVIKTRDLDAIYRDSQIVDGWNSLCLCPMCAAKYLYCSKDLSTFADQVLNLSIIPSARVVYEIKIKLNGKTEVIHYMPKHIYALQRALKFFEAYEKRDAAKREQENNTQ